MHGWPPGSLCLVFYSSFPHSICFAFLVCSPLPSPQLSAIATSLSLTTRSTATGHSPQMPVLHCSSDSVVCACMHGILSPATQQVALSESSCWPEASSHLCSLWWRHWLTLKPQPCYAVPCSKWSSCALLWWMFPVFAQLAMPARSTTLKSPPSREPLLPIVSGWRPHFLLQLVFQGLMSDWLSVVGKQLTVWGWQHQVEQSHYLPCGHDPEEKRWR